MADWSYVVSANGQVRGRPQSELVSAAKSHGIHVYASVNNGYSKSVMASILTNSSAMHTFINDMTQIAINNGYTGVNLDLENNPVEERQKFVGMVRELAVNLHRNGKSLTVTVPAVRSAHSGYDLQSLGKVSDGIVVMAYDYTFKTQNSGPIAPLWWVRQVLSYNLRRIPAYKLILGLGVYGYDWGPSTSSAVSEMKAEQLTKQPGSTTHWDFKNESEWFTYSDSKDALHTVYYDNNRSLELELTLATKDHLRGVSIWPVGGETSGLDRALAHFTH